MSAEIESTKKTKVLRGCLIGGALPGILLIAKAVLAVFFGYSEGTTAAAVSDYLINQQWDILAVALIVFGVVGWSQRARGIAAIVKAVGVCVVVCVAFGIPMSFVAMMVAFMLFH